MTSNALVFLIVCPVGCTPKYQFQVISYADRRCTYNDTRRGYEQLDEKSKLLVLELKQGPYGLVEFA